MLHMRLILSLYYFIVEGTHKYIHFETHKVLINNSALMGLYSTFLKYFNRIIQKYISTIIVNAYLIMNTDTC